MCIFHIIHKKQFTQKLTNEVIISLGMLSKVRNIMRSQSPHMMKMNVTSWCTSQTYGVKLNLLHCGWDVKWRAATGGPKEYLS